MSVAMTTVALTTERFRRAPAATVGAACQSINNILFQTNQRKLTFF
jgi:hypothetical protein